MFFAVFVLAFSALPALHADPVYTPTNNAAIDGNITLALNGGSPYTHFGADFYVNSSSGACSHVLPYGGVLGTPTAFYDTDYTYDQGYYSIAYSGFTPWYALSVFGHPRLSPGTQVSAPSGLTPGIIGDLTDIPAGKYTLEYTVTDISELDVGGVGNVCDEDYIHTVDIYKMDFAERERTVYMMQNDVYRIDLSTIPAEFPHENCCYVAVSWATMPMPGMNIVSDLYTDAACNNMITPDSSGGVSKKWQVGSVPLYIYFKMPAFGKTINLSLYATNSIQAPVLAQKNIVFTTTGLYCHLVRYIYSNGKYAYNVLDNTGSVVLDKSYPCGLWKDLETISGSGFDGFAFEKYPYQNDETSEDKNTPFIVEMGEKLVLTELELADVGANTFDGSSDYIISANTQFPFSSSHFTVTQENGYKRLSATSELESAYPVSDTVGIKYLTLPWKVQTAGGSTIVSGSCDIKVYVPFDTPKISGCRWLLGGEISSCDMHHNGLFEDILAISCSAAEGASTKAGVFDLIWKKIQTCHIELMDGRVLQYWGHGYNTEDGHDSAGYLMLKADGRCGSWSSLFVDLLRSQRIDADYFNNVLNFRIDAIPSAYIGYNPFSGGAFYYGVQYGINSPVRLRQKPTRFQGGGHPESVNFQNHAINMYNNKLYDATNGKGGYDCTKSGFRQYLQENCYITVGDYTALIGTDLEPGYFHTDHELPED